MRKPPSRRLMILTIGLLCACANLGWAETAPGTNILPPGFGTIPTDLMVVPARVQSDPAQPDRAVFIADLEGTAVILLGGRDQLGDLIDPSFLGPFPVPPPGDGDGGDPQPKVPVTFNGIKKTDQLPKGIQVACLCPFKKGNCTCSFGG